MSPKMTGTQIYKLPNWYFAEKIFHVALLLRYHIFHAKFTHLFVFVVGDHQLYYQILQSSFSKCKCCETKALIKKTKTTCQVGYIGKAIGKTKQKVSII